MTELAEIENVTRRQAGERRPRPGAPHRRARARPLRGRRRPGPPVPRARRCRRRLRALARRRAAGEGDGPPLQGRGRRRRARARRGARARRSSCCEVAPNPIAIKAALNLLGHDVGGHRLPLVDATEEEREQVRGCLARLGLLQPARRSRRIDSARERSSDHPARRPRRGRQEHDRVRARRASSSSSTRVSPSRATSISASTSCCPDSRYLRGTPRQRGRSHARPRGSRRRAPVPAARGRLRRGDRHAADARPDQVEARRARARSLDQAARGRPTASRSQVGPFTLEFVRVAHSIPDCVAVVDRDRRRSRRAHRRLEARPHAGRRSEDRRRAARGDREPRRRPDARRLDERGAARA